MREEQAANGEGEFYEVAVIDVARTDVDVDLQHSRTGQVRVDSTVSVVVRAPDSDFERGVDRDSDGTFDLVWDAELPGRVLVAPLGSPYDSPSSNLDLAEDRRSDQCGLRVRLVALEILVEWGKGTIIGLSHQIEVEISRVAAGHIVLSNHCKRGHAHREKQRHESQRAGALLRRHRTPWPASIP